MKKLLFLIPCLLLAGCGVQNECQESVKDILKAPSTAIFSKMETYKTDTFGKVVGGFVESQNSFGAMVGDKFYCVKVGNENVVILRDSDKDRFDEVTDAIGGKTWGNDAGKVECEETMQKVLNDNSIKFIRYMGDESNDSFKINGGIIKHNGEYKNVFCYMDDEMGGIYQVKIEDKTYKITKKSEDSQTDKYDWKTNKPS